MQYPVPDTIKSVMIIFAFKLRFNIAICTNMSFNNDPTILISIRVTKKLCTAELFTYDTTQETKNKDNVP